MDKKVLLLATAGLVGYYLIKQTAGAGREGPPPSDTSKRIGYWKKGGWEVWSTEKALYIRGWKKLLFVTIPIRITIKWSEWKDKWPKWKGAVTAVFGKETTDEIEKTAVPFWEQYERGVESPLGGYVYERPYPFRKELRSTYHRMKAQW